MSGTDYRALTIDLLELYASPDQQLKYARDVPFVSVPTELVCMWFDDFWHPDQELRACFTESELAAVEDFHRTFAARADKLEASSVEGLLTLPAWQEVMDHARRTLEALRS